MIKSILIKKFCSICNGNGCYDCSNKGYYKEWLDFETLIDELEEYFYPKIDRR